MYRLNKKKSQKFNKEIYCRQPDVSTRPVWKQYNSSRDQWTTRSGYGLNTEVSVELSDVDDTMYAGNAKVNAYYSEFNYSTAENRSNMLLLADEDADEDEYTAFFTFDSDTDSISGGKMHKTPIWYPDGEYTVKYAVTYRFRRRCRLYLLRNR